MLQLKGTDNVGNPCYFMGITAPEMSKILFEGLPLIIDLTGLNGANELKIITIYGRDEQAIIDQLNAAGIDVSLPVESGQQS